MTGVEIVLDEAGRKAIMITSDYADYLLSNYTSYRLGERSELTLRVEIRRYWDNLMKVSA